VRRVRGWLVRLAALFSGGGRERDFNDEIESHVQMHADEYVRQGLTPEQARRAAILKLGSVQTVREDHHDQRGIPLLEHLAQDLRYAVRTLSRTTGVTLLAIATIAIGIAGPTVMFTMAKAWILDPLPFARPHDLLDLRNLDKVSGNSGSIAAADFLDMQRAARSLDGLAAYRSDAVRVTGGDRPERVRAAQATPNFFQLLGTHPAAGRLFDAADAQRASRKLVVISHAMWRERFNADPARLGTNVQLEGEEHTIVGILPDGFQFTLLGRVDVWRPLVFTPEEAANRRQRSMLGLGLLRRGHSVEEARGELTALSERFAALYPETNTRRSVRVVTLSDEVRRHHDMGFIVPVLFAMMICVLLVACVNVTNVMLARASTRRQETAIRLALGASRVRIVRQWLVEHIVLFVAASAIGAVLAVYGVDWITHAIPEDNRQYLRNNAVLTVDRTVILFALGLGALSGIVFGWLPAWSGARTNVNVDLRDGAARATTNQRGARLRSALMVGEMAFALALLISAAFLVQTSRNISHVDVGFEPRNLLTFQLALDSKRYPNPPAIAAFYQALAADLGDRPGITHAGAGSLVPFGNEGRGTELFFEGQPEPVPAETPGAVLNEISADYPATLGLRLRRGRFIDARDTAAAPNVVMINETLASRYFAGRDPVGQRVRLVRASTDLWTIVGVVADVKNFETVEVSEPHVYVPMLQRPRRQMTVAVRSSGDPAALAATVRSAVAALDPAEPLVDVATMENRIRRVTGPFSVMSTFVTFFGVVTLLLAGVGVYGVIAYSFAQRTREIGIRMALGARRADVARLVLNQIRTFVVGGLVPGIVMAAAFGHAMRALLFGVTPTDWRLYAAMTAILALVGILAALVPTRRAVSIDPMTALRYE
jgi:putative ABC transport system permease protein